MPVMFEHINEFLPPAPAYLSLFLLNIVHGRKVDMFLSR